MGTFGFGPFDNDVALDFLDEVEDAPPQERAGLLRGAMDQVLGVCGHVPATRMSEAIAAAAVVGIWLAPGAETPEHHQPLWLSDEHLPVDAALGGNARRVLALALVPETNELWDLWQEMDASEYARSALLRTVERLSGAIA